MNNSELLFHGLGYAIAYAVPVALIFAASFYLLDAVTPGHKIGDRMRGNKENALAGSAPAFAPSYSAGLVAGAWMLGQSFVLYSAIWHNGDSNLGWSLINTLAFSLVGAVLLAGTFLIVDFLTPGSLSSEVCAPGPVVPLAIFTACALLGMGAVVAACIA